MTASPSAVQRLQTRVSGQGTGRIGSAAGAVGSRGTPTSQRGRFAKFGSLYGDETGALSALATTMQARRAFENGTMAATAKKPFDADAYEAKERKRRGLKPRAMLPGGAGAQPVNQKPAPPAQVPMMAAQNPAAPKAPALPTMPSAIVKPPSQYLGQPRAHLSPAKFNLSDQYRPKFNARIGVS